MFLDVVLLRAISCRCVGGNVLACTHTSEYNNKHIDFISLPFFFFLLSRVAVLVTKTFSRVYVSNEQEIRLREPDTNRNNLNSTRKRPNTSTCRHGEYSQKGTYPALKPRCNLSVDTPRVFRSFPFVSK